MIFVFDVFSRRRRIKVLSSRRFNIEKTSNHVHEFPVVCPEEQSQLNQEGKSPGDLPRERPHMEFIWDELLSDWLLFVCREGSWFRLNPSDGFGQ